MPKAKDINDPASVTAFIQRLEPVVAKVVEAIRGIILDAHKEVGEQIKWNSPSFFYLGEMKPFNPKEYKRDLVVFNVRKGIVLLVSQPVLALKIQQGFLKVIILMAGVLPLLKI